VATFRKLIPRVLAAAPQAILLIVSNPVDVLTYVSLKLSGGPARACLGRNRAGHVPVPFPAGEAAERGGGQRARLHGRGTRDSEVPLWSSVHIAATGLDQFSSPNVPPLTEGDREEIFRNVRDAAAQVIAAKARPTGRWGWRWSASSRRFCGTSRPSSR